MLHDYISLLPLLRSQTFFLLANIIMTIQTFSSSSSEEKSGGGADCHRQASGHWIVDTPISNPMSMYEEYRASRTSWGIGALGSVIVEVELNDDDRTTGVGLSIGGDAACFIVENHCQFFTILWKLSVVAKCPNHNLFFVVRSITFCGGPRSFKCRVDLGSNVEVNDELRSKGNCYPSHFSGEATHFWHYLLQ